MWNLKLAIYIISVLLISLFVAVKKPQMHKQAVISDSAYSFVEVEVPPAPSNIKQQDINSKDNDIKVVDSTSNRGISTQNVSKPSAKNTFKPTTNRETKPKNELKKTETSAPKQTQPAKTTPSQNPKTTQPPKTVDVNPTQNVENKQTKPVLTEEEEIIAWNHWRSRLQNQVMQDSKISAPLGTQFKFTFTVDKYGNMSNVKVWSTNPTYSDLAVRVIKPVLMNYSHKPILKFPYGTKRIITNVEGGFVISRVSRYSSPSDYNDYERVRR